MITETRCRKCFTVFNIAEDLEPLLKQDLDSNKEPVEDQFSADCPACGCSKIFIMKDGDVSPADPKQAAAIEAATP
jgi:hypothetical protein